MEKRREASRGDPVDGEVDIALSGDAAAPAAGGDGWGRKRRGSMMTDREDDGWPILSVGFRGSGFKSRMAGRRRKRGGYTASRTNLGAGRPSGVWAPRRPFSLWQFGQHDDCMVVRHCWLRIGEVLSNCD